jgi:hypothetical protein
MDLVGWDMTRRTPPAAMFVAVLALGVGCSDVDDVTGDLVELGQVYDCDMVTQLDGATTHDRSRQCFADEVEAMAFMRGWAYEHCPANAICSGTCTTPDLGLDACVVED